MGEYIDVGIQTSILPLSIILSSIVLGIFALFGEETEPVESLIMIMRLKLLAKKCGFNKIKLKKPNILIETKLKNSTFKMLKNSLASSVQNKFNFNEGEQLSIITIRGLGATEIQNQIDQLMLWFGSFEREIKNFDKELIKRE